jgi:hypothetical protein
MISHILMNRFNVRSSPGDSTKGLSIVWLDERLALFEKYCLPSITGQTTRPDVWLILFDAETPPEIKKVMEKWQRQFHFIVPVYLDCFNQAVAVGLVNGYKAHDADWLMTTRLDNDDALHPLFFEQLRQNVKEGYREFLNIPHGLIAANGKFYRKSDWSSPFITFSESASNPETVWIDQHHLLARHASIRQLALRDGWIQIVHGRNLANQIRGIRAPISSLDRSSLPPALLVDLVSESFIDLCMDNSFGLIRRYSGSLFRFVRTKLRDWNNTRKTVSS